MAVERLELYLESYKSHPFIKDFNDQIALTPTDEETLAQWITLQVGHSIELHRHLKIEDIRHHYLDNVDPLVHSTCVRVRIVR